MGRKCGERTGSSEEGTIRARVKVGESFLFVFCFLILLLLFSFFLPYTAVLYDAISCMYIFGEKVFRGKHRKQS